MTKTGLLPRRVSRYATGAQFRIAGLAFLIALVTAVWCTTPCYSAPLRITISCPQGSYYTTVSPWGSGTDPAHVGPDDIITWDYPLATSNGEPVLIAIYKAGLFANHADSFWIMPGHSMSTKVSHNPQSQYDYVVVNLDTRYCLQAFTLELKTKKLRPAARSRAPGQVGPWVDVP